VRLGYLDFDLIYEVVDFPDKFWDETDEFRKSARTVNWFDANKRLPDFWKNFEYLHDRYVERRKLEGAQKAM
jgi:hypothetical protein